MILMMMKVITEAKTTVIATAAICTSNCSGVALDEAGDPADGADGEDAHADRTDDAADAVDGEDVERVVDAEAVTQAAWRRSRPHRPRGRG